ncbi:GtrA family protein [Dactylosporangium roseum]|uniref:GtrA family protein n=1 Tax=Dactylosporangium roseum TaxID=47989 RepID=A0ABY5ZDR2_9ACTN|nr:GtrA family protein [Dactylosporangium roseum]
MARTLRKHRELVKFAIVGGFCYAVTLVVNYGLRLTVLERKPVTALIIANVVASVVSYFLNREWSFRTRGGRRRHHEMLLYLLINGAGVAVNAAPLFVARYVFGLQHPAVSGLAEEVSDFAFGMVLGTALAMLFRLWAYRTWVFPHDDVRPAPDRSEVHAQTAPASPLATDSPGA